MAEIPETQTVLILYAAKQPYETAEGYQVPEILQDEPEVLVKTEHIGLNPIDWKAPYVTSPAPCCARPIHPIERQRLFFLPTLPLC